MDIVSVTLSFTINETLKWLPSLLIWTQDHSGGGNVAWDIVSIFSWDLGSHQYLSGDNSALKKWFKPNQLMGWVSSDFMSREKS